MVVTHKYNEKAAVATMITAAEPAKHQHNRLQIRESQIHIGADLEQAYRSFNEDSGILECIYGTFLM